MAPSALQFARGCAKARRAAARHRAACAALSAVLCAGCHLLHVPGRDGHGGGCVRGRGWDTPSCGGGAGGRAGAGGTAVGPLRRTAVAMNVLHLVRVLLAFASPSADGPAGSVGARACRDRGWHAPPAAPRSVLTQARLAAQSRSTSCRASLASTASSRRARNATRATSSTARGPTACRTSTAPSSPPSWRRSLCAFARARAHSAACPHAQLYAHACTNACHAHRSALT
jgi:hypothetical protein